MQNTAQALRDLALGPQYNRQVQISFPDDNAPYGILLPNAFEAVEALSKDFAYKIEILSDNDHLAPKISSASALRSVWRAATEACDISTAIFSRSGTFARMAAGYSMRRTQARGCAT
ncbi:MULTISPECIES: hypothetical protein [Burkholderia]|uniref:Uncharacterized protein n=1 Tax=Burkholderia sola TaxID=2843302 RepID=A0ABV2CGF8_9BURK|nr:hypothetical protein [Burkholderia sp. CpTa8-5]